MGDCVLLYVLVGRVQGGWPWPWLTLEAAAVTARHSYSGRPDMHTEYSRRPMDTMDGCRQRYACNDAL